jgi:transcriptional regulator with XRE-family HTH domain
MSVLRPAPSNHQASPDAAPRVGATIRRLRQERGLSLAELATQAGVSTGALSEIERDVANPSLRILTKIRLALDVPLSTLFDEAGGAQGDPDFVRRASRRPKLDLGAQYVVKELLSSSIARNMQFMILHVPPGGGSGDDALSYPADKGGLMIEGCIVLTVGGVDVQLNVGDSFQFDSSTPHSFRNMSDSTAQVLWIVAQTRPERHF